MNIFLPLPSVLKVIIYLKNKTAAVDAGGGAGERGALLCALSGEGLTKWVLFSSKYCQRVKAPGKVEKHPAEAALLPPLPPESPATHFCLGFGIQAAHAGFLKNLELVLTGEN